MIPEYLRGPIAPVFTAFDSEGRLDDLGQREFLDFLSESGAISAFFLRCGMGQMREFSYDEVKQIADNACAHMKGRGPVMIGTTGIWDRDYDRLPDPDVFLREAVELSQYVESVGAAACVHTVPEAIAPKDGETTADVTLRYFEAIDAAVSIPVFIYQPPGTRPEYIVTVDLMQKLADLPNVKGMKASTADAGYILDMTWATRDKDFGYIVGHEAAFFAGLCSGAKATIGGGACVNPQVLKAVQDRFEQGDIPGAIDAQRSVNKLWQGIPATVEFLKRYAADKGYKVQPYRRSKQKDAAYGPVDVSIPQDVYEAGKHLLESELALYA